MGSARKELFIAPKDPHTGQGWKNLGKTFIYTTLLDQAGKSYCNLSGGVVLIV